MIEESVSENPSERTSFASIAKEKHINEAARKEFVSLRRKRDDDLAMIIVGPFLYALSFAFLQLSFTKVDYELVILSLSFFVSMICAVSGLFFLLFGAIRFVIHEQKIRSYEEDE